ncbi:MAG: Tex-like N-terminal domain-containing protein [Planctomycetota bacterium]|nr:Tex-like N-terminal domain-containing protein [Planctomycetota bacterium]
MAAKATLERLQAEFDSPAEHIAAAVEFFEQQAPPSFISRYRSWMVGDMPEERLQAIEERYRFLTEMEQRKQSILEQAKERGQLTDDLQQTVDNCADQDLLDDLYQSMRPRRRTLGMQMEEKGLMPLALAIQHRQLGELSLQDAAKEYISEENNLPTVESVLEGVLVILSEKITNDPTTRARSRDELTRGILRARAVNPGKGSGERYRQFFDFAEPIGRIPPNRMLALRRAEREGILKIELGLSEGRHLTLLRSLHAQDLPATAAPKKSRRRRKPAPAGAAPPPEESNEAGQENDTAAESSTTESPVEDAPAAEGATAETTDQAPTTEPAESPAEDAPAAEGETAETADQAPTTEPAESPAEDAPAAEGAAAGTADQAPTTETGDSPAEDAPVAEAAAPAQASGEAGAETSSADAPAAPGEDAPDKPTDPLMVLSQFFDLVFDHAWTHGLQEACARDVRRRMKHKADRESVRSYARNLRSQLLAPPLGDKKVLALRTSTKTVWFALLGEDGSVVEHGTLATNNDEELKAAIERLVAMITEHKPAAVAVPHGRRQAGTEKLIEALRNAADADTLPMVVPVDEAASAIFTTSSAGRKALSRVEVGVRTAISLGRRLQDPMRELLRMDVRTLGLGQTLDDVHQGMLRRELDDVISSCVAAVGIDINTCDQGLLTHVPGLNEERAKAIIAHRKKLGGFKNRTQIAEAPNLGAAAFRHIGGFLQVQGGDTPLDRSTVHPEDYEIGQAIAAKMECTAEELFGKDLREVKIDEFAQEDITRGRVLSVLQALRKAGTDVRGELAATVNVGVNTLADLRMDQELKGRVANMTEFGAFIDLGIGQDGLVHISQIPQHRLRDPEQMLRVGEVVQVWVVNVDQEKRKISLTMHLPRHIAEGRQPTLGERLQRGMGRQAQRRGGGRGRQGGQGRGRGREREREEQPAFSRAARTPDSRRGQRRGAPLSPEGKPTGGGEGGGPPRDRGPRGRRPGRDRGDRPSREDRGDGKGRVITVESSREVEEAKGHKGELTSLSSLKGLLDKKPEDSQE